MKARAPLLASLALACCPAASQTTYALVAAMGNKFEVVHEVQATGSHLPPYRRETLEVGANTLNLLVLKNLDAGIERKEPASKRVLVSFNLALQPDNPIEPVVEQLRAMPREGWDRVIVATPALRVASREGLPNRLQGLGIFHQPLCQGDPESCERGSRPSIGAQTLTPQGEQITANSYVAPFSFLELWILDGKTLEVIERSQSFGHTKLSDAYGSGVEVLRGGQREFLAAQILGVVTSAVNEAVAGTQLRGKVEVKERGAVRE